MLKICKEKKCRVEFEGTSNALRCYDCRKIATKRLQDAYQKEYRIKNGKKIKALQASYHKDEAHASGFF